MTIAPEMREVIEGGEFNFNSLDAADGLYTAEYAEKLKKLSRVKWDGEPKEVPPILLGLPPDSEVIFDGGLRRVDSVIYQFKEQIKRQENGRFELREVAAILANASQSAAGLNANTSAVVDRMKKAFEKGKLRFYDSNGWLIEPEDQKEDFSMYLGWYGDFTTPEAVNAWLESTGSPLRFPGSEPQPAPVVAVGAPCDVGPGSTGSGWSLKPTSQIDRAPGYRWPLYQVLQDAHKAGKLCPKARDVLEIWRLNPPPDVQVMPDGVKYNNGLGDLKEANLKAIQQAIKGLLKL